MERGGAHKILPLREIHVQLVVVERVKDILFSGVASVKMLMVL